MIILMCICTNESVKIMCFLTAPKLQGTESIEAFLINLKRALLSPRNEPKIINFRFEIYVFTSQ